MKTLIAILLAVTFACSTHWLCGRVEEEKNRVKDLQEEVNFLGDRVDEAERVTALFIEHSVERHANELAQLKDDTLIVERQIRSFEAKVEYMGTAGLGGTIALSAITRKIGGIRDELNEGPVDQPTLLFWIDDVFEMSVDATRDMDRAFLQNDLPEKEPVFRVE